MSRNENSRSAPAMIMARSRSQDRRRIELLFLAQDDDDSRRFVETLVEDHAIRIVPNLAFLRSALTARGADLLILDSAAFHQEDPTEACRALRQTSGVAMILLLAPDDTEARIQALEAGADDCFSKSLCPREVRARVASLARRAVFGASASSGHEALRFAGWTLNAAQRHLVDPRGQRVDLTAAEFDLLLTFCRNSGRTLSRRALLTHSSVGAAGPIERSIDVHVSRLRAKIEQDPHRPIFLRTVRLAGYVFTPAVEVDLALTDGSEEQS